MPTRFLTDEQIAQVGQFAAVPPDQATLERFFVLDDADQDLIAKRRGDHNRLVSGKLVLQQPHRELVEPLTVALAVNVLRGQGYPVRDEDAARLSPLGYAHINMLGRYSFPAPSAEQTLRPLRDPEATSE